VERASVSNRNQQRVHVLLWWLSTTYAELMSGGGYGLLID